jgi:hypothetical protein
MELMESWWTGGSAELGIQGVAGVFSAVSEKAPLPAKDARNGAPGLR